MEKAVVRRGIGAVVLALVAALLLGYLLKGKGPERKQVVNMELPKSPIQIFPDGSGNSANGSGKAEVVATTASKTGSGSNATGAVKDGAKTTGNVVADAGKAAGKKLVGIGSGKDKPVDSKTGNPSLAKTNVVVDGSGQAIYGAKTGGVKNTPANFEFRTPGKREVRPSIDGRLTAKKTDKTSGTSKKVVKSKTKYKLMNEKKLAPVGSKKERRVASSRNKSSSSKKAARVAKKPAKKTAATGRNKYVVQLLATSNVAKANSLKATMAREGYPAYVSTTKRGGKSLYRVRIGSYSGKSSAIKKQASMKRRYLKNPYVQSSIVVRN